MNDLLKKVLNIWQRRSKNSVKWLLILLVLLSIAALLWTILNGGLDDLGVNVFASLIAFIGGLIVLDFLSILLAHYEDEGKVCYDDAVQKEQYGNHYWHEFLLHRKDVYIPVPADRHIKTGIKGTLPDKFWHWIKRTRVRIGLRLKAKPRKPGESQGMARVYAKMLFKVNKATKFMVSDLPGLDHEFHVDEFIKNNAAELMSAHGKSKQSHGYTIRLKEVRTGENSVAIQTVRSTYIAHLLTNRAIDYKIGGDISIRDLFENKPCLTPLPYSRLSNHIGINVLVFLEGRKYLLLGERSKDGTIAKGMIIASWADRLKMTDYKEKLEAEYVAGGFITDNLSGLAQAISVHPEWLKDLLAKKKLKKQFLGASRDIYEGGKPTFFYTVDLNCTVAEYMEEKYRFKKDADARKEKGMDSSSRILVALWDTLHMNQGYFGKKRDDRLSFYAWHHFKYRMDAELLNRGCEKNLIAAFWFLNGCPGVSESEKSEIEFED